MIVVGAIFLGVGLVVAVSAWRNAHAKEIIPWRDDLAKGLDEAREQHKDVFAYFTANWCTYCQQMKHDAWASEDVRRAMLRHFVPVKIDADAHPELVKKYGVDAFPTFVVLSDDGHPGRRTDGARDADEMQEWLEK